VNDIREEWFVKRDEELFRDYNLSFGVLERETPLHCFFEISRLPVLGWSVAFPTVRYVLYRLVFLLL
jgi:hypothetical protein